MTRAQGRWCNEVAGLPERLEMAAELPRVPSGKVQKFRLREMAKELAAMPT